MKNLAMLIRILAVIGFFFLPKSFNYWKQAGTGFAVVKYVDSHNANLTTMSDKEYDYLKDTANSEGTMCGILMLLGFNIPFLICIFLSTFIATPLKLGEDQRLFLWLYLGSVVVGLVCLPFGFSRYSQQLQELPVAFVAACFGWLICGGIPLGIALTSKTILIRRMKKNANQGMDLTR